MYILHKVTITLLLWLEPCEPICLQYVNQIVTIYPFVNPHDNVNATLTPPPPLSVPIPHVPYNKIISRLHLYNCNHFKVQLRHWFLIVKWSFFIAFKNGQALIGMVTQFYKRWCRCIRTCVKQELWIVWMIGNSLKQSSLQPLEHVFEQLWHITSSILMSHSCFTWSIPTWSIELNPKHAVVNE